MRSVPSNCGFVPTEIAAGIASSATCSQPAYTPSAGMAVCGRVSTLAVGNPSSRPRWAPRTTTPSTRCGRPRISRAPSTSPSATSRRVRVEENGSPPPASPVTYRSTTSTSKSYVSPCSRRKSTLPAALWPKRKFGPSTTAFACSLSTRTFTTKSAGDSFENSLVKGRMSRASTPSSAISSARRWCGASSGGWLPGRTTSLGCGSNVTTTEGTPSSRARSTACLMISWCPRWTPS